MALCEGRQAEPEEEDAAAQQPLGGPMCPLAFDLGCNLADSEWALNGVCLVRVVLIGGLILISDATKALHAVMELLPSIKANITKNQDPDIPCRKAATPVAKAKPRIPRPHRFPPQRVFCPLRGASTCYPNLCAWGTGTECIVKVAFTTHATAALGFLRSLGH